MTFEIKNSIYSNSYGTLEAQIAALANLGNQTGWVPATDVRALLQHIGSVKAAIEAVDAPAETEPVVEPVAVAPVVAPFVDAVAVAPVVEVSTFVAPVDPETGLLLPAAEVAAS